MTNRDRAEELFFELDECRKNHRIECLTRSHIERALGEAEKRGLMQGTRAGMFHGQTEMRERAAKLSETASTFGLPNKIRALPIEGE